MAIYEFCPRSGERLKDLRRFPYQNARLVRSECAAHYYLDIYWERTEFPLLPIGANAAMVLEGLPQHDVSRLLDLCRQIDWRTVSTAAMEEALEKLPKP